MNSHMKPFVFAAGTALALLATLMPTASAGQRAHMASRAALTAHPSEHVAAPAAACTKMQAPEGVFWVPINDDGSFGDAVTTYPSGVLTVTAAFNYTCIPNKTALTTIWSIDGETILTSKSNPKPNAKSDAYYAWLYNADGSPLSDGDYGVEFYIGQTLLASGNITVGGESENNVTTPSELTDVAVQGTVVDSKSKKPINGAMVIVLQPNVDITNWFLFGSDADQVASAKTNSKGQFVLDNRVSVDVGYPWVIGAKGYRSIADPVFTITQEIATDPYTMTIALDRVR